MLFVHAKEGKEKRFTGIEKKRGMVSVQERTKGNSKMSSLLTHRLATLHKTQALQQSGMEYQKKKKALKRTH